jgi:hypothetical protein
MSILDKVYGVWTDLENSYVESGSYLSRSEYLKKLLSYGNKANVDVLLYRCSQSELGSSDVEFTQKFAYLQETISLMIKLYNSIPDEISNLQTFVSEYVGTAKSMRMVREFPAGFLDSLIPFGRFNSYVPFSKSQYGMDVFTSSKSHVLAEIEPNVSVVLKNHIKYSAMRNMVPQDSFMKNVVSLCNTRDFSGYLVITNKDMYNHRKDTSGKQFYVEDGVLYIDYNSELKELVYV